LRFISGQPTITRANRKRSAHYHFVAFCLTPVSSGVSASCGTLAGRLELGANLALVRAADQGQDLAAVTKMKKARILIADDHETFSAAFRKLLEPEFEVLGCVSDGRMLLKAAQELKPDVVIADISMPLLDGLDAGREIKPLLPNTRINLPQHESRLRIGTRSGPNWCFRVPPENFPSLGAAKKQSGSLWRQGRPSGWG
jgi:hypothetical protein